MGKTVTASEDWLSFALAEYDDEKIAANRKRGEIALNVRIEQRFAKFIHQATDKDDLAVRLDAVDEAVRDTAEQVALEYGDDPVKLYEAAVKKLTEHPAESYGELPPGHDEAYDDPYAESCPHCGGQGVYMGKLGNTDHFRCRNCGSDFSLRADEGKYGLPNAFEEPSGASMMPPHGAGTKIADGVTMPAPQAYDYKRVDPDSTIGDSPAGARGPNFEYDRDADDTLGQSKDHPREMQDVKQFVEDRRELQDNDDGPESIKRKVETIDADKTIGDAKGVGGTFPRGNQSNPITSKFYLLD